PGSRGERKPSVSSRRGRNDVAAFTASRPSVAPRVPPARRPEERQGEAFPRRKRVTMSKDNTRNDERGRRLSRGRFLTAAGAGVATLAGLGGAARAAKPPLRGGSPLVKGGT